MRSSCCWRPIDAQLDRRRQRRRRAWNDVCTRSPASSRASVAPGSSSPIDGQQRGLRAQRCGVARDVGRAAGSLLGARDLDDRHRRFGRDALDLAEPVAVEHHVADDEHARARDALAPRRESRCAARCTLGRRRRAHAAPDREVFEARPRAPRPASYRLRPSKTSGCLKALPSASKSGLRNSFHSVTTTSASAPSQRRHRRRREATATARRRSARRASSIATGS